MKKNIFVYGLIAGLIAGGWLAAAVFIWRDQPNYENGMWMGYASMILAFTFIYAGIKNTRDKHLQGTISFGKAFGTGALITLVASTIYVGIWLIVFNFFAPDYMVRYTDYMNNKLISSGASLAEIAEHKKTMDGYLEMYQSTPMVILMTYLEILPVGLLVSVVSALFLRRRQSRTGRG